MFVFVLLFVVLVLGILFRWCVDVVFCWVGLGCFWRWYRGWMVVFLVLICGWICWGDWLGGWCVGFGYLCVLVFCLGSCCWGWCCLFVGVCWRGLCVVCVVVVLFCGWGCWLFFLGWLFWCFVLVVVGFGVLVCCYVLLFVFCIICYGCWIMVVWFILVRENVVLVGWSVVLVFCWCFFVVSLVDVCVRCWCFLLLVICWVGDWLGVLSWLWGYWWRFGLCRLVLGWWYSDRLVLVNFLLGFGSVFCFWWYVVLLGVVWLCLVIGLLFCWVGFGYCVVVWFCCRVSVSCFGYWWGDSGFLFGFCEVICGYGWKRFLGCLDVFVWWVFVNFVFVSWGWVGCLCFCCRILVSGVFVWFVGCRLLLVCCWLGCVVVCGLFVFVFFGVGFCWCWVVCWIVLVCCCVLVVDFRCVVSGVCCGYLVDVGKGFGLVFGCCVGWYVGVGWVCWCLLVVVGFVGVLVVFDDICWLILGCCVRLVLVWRVFVLFSNVISCCWLFFVIVLVCVNCCVVCGVCSGLLFGLLVVLWGIVSFVVWVFGWVVLVILVVLVMFLGGYCVLLLVLGRVCFCWFVGVVLRCFCYGVVSVCLFFCVGCCWWVVGLVVVNCCC